MRGKVSALEHALRMASLREFELLGEDPPAPSLLERLRDCCAVTAAVGPSARDELVDTICQREMGIYTQIFGTVGETAKLERTVNRYKWLLRRLESRRDVWGIFPSDWKVPQILTVTFCSMTKTALAEILDENAAQLQHMVDPLLKAVEATHIFETEMARRFGEASNGGSLTPQSTTPKADKDGAHHNSRVHYKNNDESDDMTCGLAASKARQTLDAMKQRYRHNHTTSMDSEPSSLQNNNAHDSIGRDDDRMHQHAAANAAAKAHFRGAISTVFHPYLTVYVNQVERELLFSVDQLVASETWLPLSHEQMILRSANELTDAIRNEMKDCVARVSRDKTLVAVAQVFQRVYTAYAAKLVARLPKTHAGGTSGVPVLGVTDWQIKLTDDDPGVICLVLTTAEHCIELIDQLERAIKSKLESPTLSDDIDSSELEEEFRSVATKCVSVLLLGVETKLEAPLGALLKHNWASVEVVGDHSDYVNSLRSILVDIGGKIGPALPQNHFRFFCDKLLRSMSPRLLESIFRCKQISLAGCQQLRLDVEALKGTLLQLAKSGGTGVDAEDAAAWVQSYSLDINAQLGRVEAVLKTVSTPLAALVETFLELLPDASPAEFQRIADMKGLKRQELTAVLEEYSRRAGKVQVAAAGSGSTQRAHPLSSQQASKTPMLPLLIRSLSTTNTAAPAPGGDGSARAARPALTAQLPGSTFSLLSSPNKQQNQPSSGASPSILPESARLKFNANVQAARASAAAAGDSMRETMGRTISSMKTRFLQQRDA